MKCQLARMIGFSAVLFFLSMTAAFAFKDNIDGVYRIDALRSQILQPSVIGKICDGDRILKAEARRKRMEIASEFETKFEDYKLELRQLGDDIISLNDLKQNMQSIEYWQDRKKDINESFRQKIQTYLNNNADIYIPVVYAGFIELPITMRNRKYQLIQKQLLTDLIERYGIETIFSQTELQNGDQLYDLIRTKQRGAIEQDGIRNFEFRDLVYRTPEITKCLTVGFYRFKPFAQKRKKGRAQNSGSEMPGTSKFRFDSWNLADPESVAQMKTHIQKEFEQPEAFLQHLDKYLDSIENISKEMQRARQRISYIVKRMKELDDERKSRLEMVDSNTERLEMINRNLIDRLNLSGPVDVETLDRMIANKKRRKTALEKNFQYRFVLMAESDESRLETAVKNSLESIFDDLALMIKKQTMTIETVIANGSLKEIDETLTSYRPNFKSIYIQQYFAGQNAGVILVLDVKYGRKPREDTGSAVSEETHSSEIQGASYFESAGGLDLKMIKVNDSFTDGEPFYISESEITKAQFYRFIQAENIDTSRFFSGICPRILSDYPDDYPMLKKCMSSRSKIDRFLQWLNETSNQPYRYMLPSEKHYQQATARGIHPGNSGFRVISRRNDN
ncbi:MAG: hypothetical protein ACQERN_04860 [Thermodesulfobacteriota bacterium]